MNFVKNQQKGEQEQLMKLKIETGNHALIACPVRFTSGEQILDNNFALVL